MAESTFKPGELVRLKSGSPVMTVNYTDGGNVSCVWFNEKDQKFETAKISEGVLVRSS